MCLITDTSVRLLNEHFIPQTNSTFQRKVFLDMVQQSDKSIAQFATCLRKAGEYCNYTDLDDQIRDQIVQKCLSQRLQRKLLEKGEEITFKETLKISQVHFYVKKHMLQE